MKEEVRVGIPRKGCGDELDSRVIAISLTLSNLDLSKLVFNSPIPDYLNCF